MFVKPKQGQTVRDPVHRRPLPPEGGHVSEHDHYWIRRLRDGDIELAEPPKEEAPPASGDALPPGEPIGDPGHAIHVADDASAETAAHAE